MCLWSGHTSLWCICVTSEMVRPALGLALPCIRHSPQHIQSPGLGQDGHSSRHPRAQAGAASGAPALHLPEVAAGVMWSQTGVCFTSTTEPVSGAGCCSGHPHRRFACPWMKEWTRLLQTVQPSLPCSQYSHPEACGAACLCDPGSEAGVLVLACGDTH